MTAARLYLKRLATPGGNVGHEVVALTSMDAIRKARQSAKDARTRADDATSASEAIAAMHEAEREALKWGRGLRAFAREWAADLAKARGRGW